MQFAAAADQAIVTGTKERGPLQQDWQFSLGTFLLTTDTTVRVNRDTLEGSEIDWENEFDLQDKNPFRLDASWRFAERHKLRAMWFQNNRSSSSTTTREIDFDGTVYPVNTTVDAGFDVTVIELAYEYAFYKADKLELAGSFGIHTLKFDLSLSGTITTPGGGGSVQASSDSSFTGPLPVLGFHALWDMGHDFYLDGGVQFFYVDFDQLTGVLADLKLSALWMPWRNVGFGLGYNGFYTRLTATKNDYDGRVKFGYGGAMAFVTVSF